MKIFTIGFTNKKAEDFFERLRESGVKRIVDVRLNNVSQLAGAEYLQRHWGDVSIKHLP